MKNSQQFNIAFVLLLVAVISRFVSPTWNITAVLAVSLLGGAWLKKGSWAMLVPIAAVFVSDMVINNTLYASFNDGFVLFYPGMAFVYGSYVLIAAMGHWGMGSSQKNVYGKLAGWGLSSAVVFFLVTNFGTWLSDPIYTKDFQGLMNSYIAGIPFFRNTLVGTLAYGAILVTAKQWFEAKASSRNVA